MRARPESHAAPHDAGGVSAAAPQQSIVPVPNTCSFGIVPGDQGRANYRDMWNALRRLGHRDEIDAGRSSGESDLSNTRMNLSKLGDWDLSYVTPG